MNRNVESHFSDLPAAEIQRSIFDRSSTHKTSFDVGYLIPIYVDEVLPGDSFKMESSKVVRLQTMLTPIMDNMYLDTYFFFVPNRLVWTHWKEFMGENTDSAWIPQNTYTVPTIAAPSGGWNVGTIADYFGIPTGVAFSNSTDIRVSALPFRAYALICNEFFRDQNVTDPLNITLTDSNQTGSNGSSYINDVANGGIPFKVAKYHDYFTSCLPSPQKGPTVTVNLANQKAPVFTFNEQVPDYRSSAGPSIAPLIASYGPSPVYDKIGISPANSTDWLEGRPYQGASSYANALSQNWLNGMYPENLWADISAAAGISINELRLSFQLQKFYEKQARGGSRYIEVLKSHFGVTSPDARLQRPEYLGGNRIPLNVHEVTNSAQSTQDFLGDLGAKSATSDVHYDFEKSFTEHGFIIGLCCVRYDHSYPQGLERFWNRRNFYDYYWPVFANIGEQPVRKAEIYANLTNITRVDLQDPNSTPIFGYQEAWAEYRYKPDRVSGEMRPGISNTLASWHLSDYYTSSPSLSDSWIREDKTNVDRVLAVQSSAANQVFADFYFKCIATRPMPMYSIPGLIDHH